MTNVFSGVPVQGFDAPHHVRFTTPDGLTMYILTGVVLITFKGAPNAVWVNDTLTFNVAIPGLPDRHGLRLHHWAPYVSLNTIANDGEGDWVAWGVDNFWLSGSDRVMREAAVSCGLAVRDVDGFILRVGYSLHLLGSIEPVPGIS